MNRSYFNLRSSKIRKQEYRTFENYFNYLFIWDQLQHANEEKDAKTHNIILINLELIVYEFFFVNMIPWQNTMSVHLDCTNECKDLLNSLPIVAAFFREVCWRSRKSFQSAWSWLWIIIYYMIVLFYTLLFIILFLFFV